VSFFDSRVKNPRLVAAGLRGARLRWGPPRVVRIDDFPDVDRASIVRALDEARLAKGIAVEDEITSHNPARQ
jgi:hypothetical protein